MIATMPFVSRNAQGAITGVFNKPTPIAQEELDLDDTELHRYLEAGNPSETQGALAASDRAMARVVEDLIDVLIAKTSSTSRIFRPKRKRRCFAVRTFGAPSPP